MMREIISINEGLVELNGYLTSANVSEVQKNLEELIDQNSILTLDITKLKKLDSVGVFMLLILKRNAENFGKNVFIVAAENEVVLKAIEESGMQKILDAV